MKNVIVIYDDRRMPGSRIRSVTGGKSFGETIVKRVPLSARIRQSAEAVKAVKGFFILSGNDDFAKLKQELTNAGLTLDSTFLYLYSNFGIRDEAEFSAVVQKCAYIDAVYTAPCDEAVAAVLLPDEKSLFGNEEKLSAGTLSGDEVSNSAFTDLSKQNHFLAYITGGFDARFFNALEGDAFTVTKKSTKVDKIKSEYKFYQMLPDDMKKWFVMPYDYREENGGAAYTMERIHTTDIAIRYVHGAVSVEELGEILEQLFYFLRTRKEKKVSKEEAGKCAEEAYVGKVQSRMEELKKSPLYEQFDRMIAMGTSYKGIDDVVKAYVALYRSIRKKAYASTGQKVQEDVLVIGHGDLCFSNILYSREAGLLKLIDPKGALDESQLYMDAYYDIAKLSHSVCGGYDFFNSGLYQVSLDRDLKWELSVDAVLAPYQEAFTAKLRENGYDPSYVRICEAGLFLSMLPYHMDQPGKVFGFLLNAIRIMEQLQ